MRGALVSSPPICRSEGDRLPILVNSLPMSAHPLLNHLAFSAAKFPSNLVCLSVNSAPLCVQDSASIWARCPCLKWWTCAMLRFCNSPSFSAFRGHSCAGKWKITSSFPLPLSSSSSAVDSGSGSSKNCNVGSGLLVWGEGMGRKVAGLEIKKR